MPAQEKVIPTVEGRLLIRQSLQRNALQFLPKQNINIGNY